MKSDRESKIYQLYVELVDSHPPIWRSFQVPGQFTLAQLHEILQTVMGWQNCHPHLFRLGAKRYGVPALKQRPPVEDEATITLSEVLSPRSQPLFYTYDPADGWLHQIELDRTFKAEPDQVYPVCLDGERACPPEKSGGVWGYEGLLDRLSDHDDPHYEELLEQIGLDFDPEKFDAKKVNKVLKTLA